jgi:hypothetical protein
MNLGEGAGADDPFPFLQTPIPNPINIEVMIVPLWHQPLP